MEYIWAILFGISALVNIALLVVIYFMWKALNVAEIIQTGMSGAKATAALLRKK